MLEWCYGEPRIDSTRGHRIRTTINLAEDALIAARNIAQREKLSLGDAVSELIRRGTASAASGVQQLPRAALRGRFALLPARDEVLTPRRVRELIEREGV